MMLTRLLYCILMLMALTMDYYGLKSAVIGYATEVQYAI